jgi:histidinol-phosphate/aromatic aminotransferase/cobyric acid decarboxylase-like protein
MTATASASYAHVDALEDGDGRLGLAWAPDERDFLAEDLDAVLSRVLRGEVGDGLPWSHSYFVKDPYGHDLLGGPVARHFAVPEDSIAVSCGAGVNSLLQALAQRCRGRTAYVIGDVYPDFPHWVGEAGGRCVSRYSGGTADTADSVLGHVARALAADAAVVMLDRPAAVSGGEPMSLSDLSLLCASVSGAASGSGSGPLVVVDESYANHQPPMFSAAGLVSTHPGLVVLRGLSKGYGLGGLRFGYCVTAPETAATVRALLAPMQVSSLSLAVAVAVLELGDVTAPLRERADEARAHTLAVLHAAGITDALQPAFGLPYLYFRPGSASPGLLRRRRVAGKDHWFWSERTLGPASLYRISTPLRERRARLFAELLAETAEPTEEP